MAMGYGYGCCCRCCVGACCAAAVVVVDVGVMLLKGKIRLMLRQRLQERVRETLLTIDGLKSMNTRREERDTAYD